MAGRGGREGSRGRRGCSREPAKFQHWSFRARRQKRVATACTRRSFRSLGASHTCSCFSSTAVLPAYTLPLGCPPPLSVRLLSGHVSADQPHRAMPSQYEPLGQEAPDDYFHAESSSRVNTAFPPKPETYYGEGPFDPPSSDDDESEVLLEKNGSRRGSGIFEEEGDLIIGSTKVRPLSCMCPVPANRPLFQETACLVEIPDPWPRNSRIYCCRHGRIRRRIIHRDTVPRTGRPAPHHGPLFQRHILYK